MKKLMSCQHQLPLLSYLCEHLFQINTAIKKNTKGIKIISTSIKGLYDSLLNSELAGEKTHKPIGTIKVRMIWMIFGYIFNGYLEYVEKL